MLEINKIYNKDNVNLYKEIPDGMFNFICTDPPYGYLKHKIETNVNIDLFFKESYRILKDNSFIAFFGIQPYLTKWINKALKNGFKYKAEIIWYKRNSTNIFSDMTRWYENIIIMQKGKRKFNKNQLIQYLILLFLNIHTKPLLLIYLMMCFSLLQKHPKCLLIYEKN